MGIKIVIYREGDSSDHAPLLAEDFDGSLVTIGSDPVSTLQLPGDSIAPEHIVIISEDGQPLLINRGTGTVLNGESLPREARRPIAPGDQLRVGDYVISLVDDALLEAVPEASSMMRQSSSVPSTDARSAPVSQLFVPLSAAHDFSASDEVLERRPLTASASPQPQSFAAILDSLRTEEDSFYFLIEGGAKADARIPVEQAEMPLGWDSEQNISHELVRIAVVCAVVRKDWSGVVVQAQGGGSVTVNGEAVDTARRLRDGDRVALTCADNAAAPETERPRLVFHEPASLLVLDSLLPQRLPEPVPARPATNDARAAVASVASGNGTSVNANGSSAAATISTGTARVRKPQTTRRYFGGAFTRLDLMVLFAGTIAATIVVYLVLRFLS